MQIRTATSADLDELMDRNERLIGAEYRWPARLGDGSSITTHLALVAVDDHTDKTIAQIGVSPFRVIRELPHYGIPSGGWDNIDQYPWWKINSLAVDAGHQGHGVARALLAAVVHRAPTAVIGFYGTVELAKAAEIAWYRRQGFYVAAAVSLPPRPGRISEGIRLGALGDEVQFYSYRTNLQQHLADRGHATYEQRIGTEEYRLQIKNLHRVTPARTDSGYRTLARRIASQGTATCPHGQLGPRPLIVVGWDPALLRTCLECSHQRIFDVERYDASDRCDGCSNRRPDVQVSWAALEEELLIVHAGLCAGCRQQ